MSQSLNTRAIIALLVVNKLGNLPKIVIDSILKNSTSNIFVGFVNPLDISDIPRSERINFYDLSSAASMLDLRVGNGEYQSFDDDYFFSLVQLKWYLILDLMSQNPSSHIIYTDVDVLWNQESDKVVVESFRALDHVEIFIQSFTVRPALPRLCMGFAAFRNSMQSSALVRECIKIHREMLKLNPRIGDDDVITELYRRKEFPEYIYQLPQTSFPVGNMLNLFRRLPMYPGLFPESPMIFHANHVVGLRKKLELLHLFSASQGKHLYSVGKVRAIAIRIMVLLRFIVQQLRKMLRFIRT